MEESAQVQWPNEGAEKGRGAISGLWGHAALRLVLLDDSNLIRHPMADKTFMTVPILGFLPFESAL